MKESDFHRMADAELAALADALEGADAKGQLELEEAGGVLTVVLPGGKTLVISKHAPSGQIWLSSPVSGGLHFAQAGGRWQLPDGRELRSLLAAELKQLAGVELP
ncbi:MAG: iron donor protein CyaY [Proteobacteria bacterium]|nr:iron donor protein CyaY [Pseudomonadota bacterium]